MLQRTFQLHSAFHRVSQAGVMLVQAGTLHSVITLHSALTIGLYMSGSV